MVGGGISQRLCRIFLVMLLGNAYSKEGHHVKKTNANQD